MRQFMLAACLCVIAPAIAAMPDGIEPAYLAPSINGKPVQNIAMFWQQDGQWFAEAGQWKSLGVQLNETEQGDLSAISLGIELKVDVASQTVDLIVPAERMPAQAKTRFANVPQLSPAAPGVLVNYSLAGRLTENSQAVSIGHEVRTAGRWGVLSTSGQANWSTDQGAQYLRGTTYWQFDDNKRLITYQAGDVIAGGSSPVSLGGVRIAKDPDGLDPYNPSYAQPSLGALALDAATVTVLTNSAQVASHDVTKGPFTVERFPLAPGRNRTQLVVNDTYGRQTVLSESQFYFSPQILRKGAKTWELAAGAVRESFDDYGKVGASARFAYGLSDRWTLQGSAQADREHRNTTLGVRTVLGVAGTLDAQVGQSSGPEGTGTSLKLAYDYQGPQFGIHAEHERNDNYWKLSNLPVEERTRLAMTWHTKDNAFRVGAGASSLKTKDLDVRFADVSVRYGRGPHTVSAGASFNLDTHEPQFDLGYRYQFDQGSLAVRARKAPDITTSLSGSYRGELAGRKFTVQGEVQDRQGEQSMRASGMVQGELVDARVDASYRYGAASLSGSVNGAVHIGKGSITPLRTSQDSFAVIDVPGVAGVPVKVNGRLMGVTDKHGRLVAGQVGSLVATQVKLDDRALPAEVQVETSEQNVAAKRRSGVHVVFPVKTQNARVFKVKRADGQEIAPGTKVTSEHENTVLGFDGELFLEHAQPGQKLNVEGQGCSITLPAPLSAFEAAPELVCSGD